MHYSKSRCGCLLRIPQKNLTDFVFFFPPVLLYKKIERFDLFWPFILCSLCGKLKETDKKYRRTDWQPFYHVPFYFQSFSSEECLSFADSWFFDTKKVLGENDDMVECALYNNFPAITLPISVPLFTRIFTKGKKRGKPGIFCKNNHTAAKAPLLSHPLRTMLFSLTANSHYLGFVFMNDCFFSVTTFVDMSLIPPLGVCTERRKTLWQMFAVPNNQCLLAVGGNRG